METVAELWCCASSQLIKMLLLSSSEIGVSNSEEYSSRIKRLSRYCSFATVLNQIQVKNLMTILMASAQRAKCISSIFPFLLAQYEASDFRHVSLLTPI